MFSTPLRSDLCIPSRFWCFRQSALPRCYLSVIVAFSYLCSFPKMSVDAAVRSSTFSALAACPGRRYLPPSFRDLFPLRPPLTPMLIATPAYVHNDTAPLSSPALLVRFSPTLTPPPVCSPSARSLVRFGCSPGPVPVADALSLPYHSY